MPKKQRHVLRTSSIVQIIFSFRYFEISEGILRNQKIIIGLDTFSNQHLIYIYIWPHLDNISRCIDYIIEKCNIRVHVILFGSMLSIYRATDEA